MMTHGEVKNYVHSLHKTTKTLFEEKQRHPKDPILDQHDLQSLHEICVWASKIVHDERELQ